MATPTTFPTTMTVRGVRRARRSGGEGAVAFVSLDGDGRVGRGRGTDQDHAVEIGAVDAGSVGSGEVDGARRGMSVRIAQAYGDDADGGGDRGEEIRVLLRAAVMRDLEHIGLQILPAVLQQDLLNRRLDVAGQQDVERPAAGVHGDGHDDGVVVGAGVLGRAVLGHAAVAHRRIGGSLQRVFGLGPQHTPCHVADLPLLVRPHTHDGDSGGRGESADLRGPGGRVIDGSGLDLVHLAALKEACETVDVVRMEVGEDREGHVGDTESPGTCVLLGGVGSGVHGDGRVRGEIEEERVALADVADGEHPGRLRGAGSGELPDQRDRRKQHQDERDEDDQTLATRMPDRIVHAHTGLRRSWIRCSERVSLRPMA